MTKTLAKIKQQFYWPNMEKEVKAHIRLCEVCQQSKPSSNTNIGLHCADIAERPLQRLFLDFMGPVVRSNSSSRFAMGL